jgi:predicted amidohydrolase YtcJ
MRPGVGGVWAALVVAGALGAGAPALTAPPSAAVADRVFLGGRVWTGSLEKPRAEAVALRGETILAVGTDAEIRRHVGPATRVEGLRGRFVAPGFNDAHIHFLVVETVDLAEAWSVEEAQRRIRDYARAHPDRPWVTGRGWPYAAFPGGLPHRKQLDAVVSDRPALMTGYDGHTAWANSRALAAAGITRDTPDPTNGVIGRDPDGEPSGVLKESAIRLVRRLVPPPTAQERYDGLKKRLRLAASYGLTSIQNASYNADELPVYERLRDEGGLSVRVYWAMPLVKDPGPDVLAEYKKMRETHRGPILKFGAVKGFVDGVVESRTAAMFEPYTGGGTGLPNWTPEELQGTVAAFDREGFQIFLHAIGDRGIDMALDAYEAAAAAHGPRDRRHRVEHVEAPRPGDIRRFKPLGVVASTQALFANPDPNTLDVYAVALGPDRASRAMAFRSIDASGAVQAFGSDSPVFSMEVLKGIYCAATRMTPQGTPAGGWNPGERISAEAALSHFTRDAAYASFEEHRKGRLVPGLLADLVVLSEDITAVAPERILETRVLLTVMGGRDTHRDPAL